MEFSISYLTILIAAAVYYILGAVWYGVFSKPWMKAMDKTEEDLEAMKKNAPKGYLLSGVASLITAYVLAHVVAISGATTFVGGMETGFWLTLGFVLTTSLSSTVFEDRPMTLYALNGGYNFVGIILMGGILANWG